jgi:rod shape-determining protein MreD
VTRGSGSAAPAAYERLPGPRFAAFAATCLLSAVLLEDALAIGPAKPDFALILLVYGAIRWGAVGGAILGFGLGLFRDALSLTNIGYHALGMTLLGYVLGKLREVLYLSAAAVDLLLLAGAKLALDVMVLAGAAGGGWAAFELRFFWEAPLSAFYTAGLGGLLYRLFRG